MPMTEAERQEFLSGVVGLNPDGPALDQTPRPAITTTPPATVRWAPDGLDPHTIPVSEIEFDPAMVEHFPDLSPKSRRAASDYLFAQYKGRRGDKDRNSLLHRRIGEFLAKTHASRKEGGAFVKDKIRLANTLAEHDVTEDQLQEFLAWKAAQG